MRQDGARRPRRRTVVITVVVAVIVIALGAAGGGYLLLRTHGSPSQTAASYLSAWQHDDYPAMGTVSVNVPAAGLAAPLKQASAQLGIKTLRLSPGLVTNDSAGAQARFTATADLASGHVWKYQG